MCVDSPLLFGWITFVVAPVVCLFVSCRCPLVVTLLHGCLILFPAQLAMRFGLRTLLRRRSLLLVQLVVVPFDVVVAVVITFTLFCVFRCLLLLTLRCCLLLFVI